MKNTSASKNDKDILSSLQARLERHFLTCTVAVGAVATFGAAQSANADIVFFDPADIQVPLNNGPGIYLNLETGAFGMTGAGTPGWNVNIFNPSAAYLQTYVPSAMTGLIGYTSGSDRYTSRLTNGTTIGPGGGFLFGGVTSMSYAGGNQWGGASTSGFLGVQFQLASGSTVFGWIGLDVMNGNNAQITSFAYETNGGPITAGARP